MISVLRLFDPSFILPLPVHRQSRYAVCATLKLIRLKFII